MHAKPLTPICDTCELLYSIPPDLISFGSGAQVARSVSANGETKCDPVVVIDTLPPAAKPLQWRIGRRYIDKVRRTSQVQASRS